MLLRLSLLVGYLSSLPLILCMTEGYTKMILIYIHAIGICILTQSLFLASKDQMNSSSSSGELYGLRHTLFNLQLPPKTMWFNMGLWNKPNMNFSTACENLVHAVIAKINMKTHSSVLDVGFGCGDSCILLAEQYHCRVTGITNELSQYKIAEKRVSCQEQHLREKIQLLHGSADNIERLIASNNTFDYILSIDSAYHYQTRWKFLQNAFDKLIENGAVGLYDLTIDPCIATEKSLLTKVFLKCVCKAVRIPSKNLVTVKEYKENVKNIGYSEIEVQELDRKEVFGGIANAFKNLDATTRQYGIGISLSNQLFLKASSIVFGLLAKRRFLIPVIVKCVKKSQKQS